MNNGDSEVPLNLRNYQTELVQEACKGTNVVCGSSNIEDWCSFV